MNCLVCSVLLLSPPKTDRASELWRERRANEEEEEEKLSSRRTVGQGFSSFLFAILCSSVPSFLSPSFLSFFPVVVVRSRERDQSRFFLSSASVFLSSFVLLVIILSGGSESTASSSSSSLGVESIDLSSYRCIDLSVCLQSILVEPRCRSPYHVVSFRPEESLVIIVIIILAKKKRKK